MNHPISILNYGSISPLGSTSEAVFKKYRSQKANFQKKGNKVVSSLRPEAEKILTEIKEESKTYQRSDRSVLLALAAARKCFEAEKPSRELGVNIGSSRGATEIFEKEHKHFLEKGSVSALTSPTTTLGNISSAVLQDLAADGPAFSHSITCSTALQAVLNATAWMRAGMAEDFLVGGTEAPLTPFTLAQIEALKLYAAHYENEAYPNRSLDFDKKYNSLILGEGAAVFHLKKGKFDRAKAVISGMGYGSEPLKHAVSLSKNAVCLQNSMKRALKDAGLSQVDAVVMHAPGTVKGDRAERNAIKKVFGEDLPYLTSNKYALGHTYGASGALSLEMAILMLKNQTFLENPHYLYPNKPKKLNHILVNAVGFGGNAVSLVVSK